MDIEHLLQYNLFSLTVPVGYMANIYMFDTAQIGTVDYAKSNQLDVYFRMILLSVWFDLTCNLQFQPAQYMI